MKIDSKIHEISYRITNRTFNVIRFLNAYPIIKTDDIMEEQEAICQPNAFQLEKQHKFTFDGLSQLNKKLKMDQNVLTR